MCEPADLDAVMDIWLRTNLSAHSFIAEDYWTGNYAFVRQAISSAEVYVEESHGRIQGFIGAVGEYIAGLFVDAPFQSIGVGSILLSELKRRKPVLTLQVYADHCRAVEFYQKHGFTIQSGQLDAATGCMEYKMLWRRKAVYESENYSGH